MILHTGDIHFRNRDVQEINKCCDFLLKQAMELKPALNIIAGDFFDEDVELGSQAAISTTQFLTALSRIAHVLILKGTNSHDGNNLSYIKKLNLPNVTVVDTICQVNLVGATISCIPSPTKANVLEYCRSKEIYENNHSTIDLLRDILQMWGSTAAKPHILVGHFTVLGSVLSTGQQMIGKDLELGVADLALAKADLICLGHIHKAQKIGKNIFYCGSLTRLNFGEDEEKGFWFHNLKDNHHQFYQTPARKMWTVEWSDNVVIDDNLTENDQVRLILRFNEGEPEPDIASLSKNLAERNISLKVEKQINPIVRTRTAGEITKAVSLKDKLGIWLKVTETSANSSMFDKLALLETADPQEILNNYTKEGNNATAVSQT